MKSVTFRCVFSDVSSQGQVVAEGSRRNQPAASAPCGSPSRGGLHPETVARRMCPSLPATMLAGYTYTLPYTTVRLLQLGSEEG
jgi:hypothetical protein